MNELQSNNLEASRLEPLKDRSNEVALDAVGLDHDVAPLSDGHDEKI